MPMSFLFRCQSQSVQPADTDRGHYSLVIVCYRCGQSVEEWFYNNHMALHENGRVNKQ